MTKDQLRNARILITGGTGFLGRHLTAVLKDEYGCKKVHPVGKKQADLTLWYEARHLFANAANLQKPYDLVFHLAGWNGGIKFNELYPADIFARNTVMAINLLQCSQEAGVQKVVSTVTSCAYPAQAVSDAGKYYDREVMEEPEFCDGPPHDTVACHGYARRNVQLMSYFCRKQHGLNAVCACPTTLYGPGDTFDPQRSKVMGGMVKRFVDAKRENAPSVTIWGSGKAMREFLFVKDAARLLVETMLHYDDCDMPLNLGSGQEMSIKDLAEKVSSVVGYSGQIYWDTSKPDGQFRKRLDLRRMTQTLPFVGVTDLVTGIKETAEWYERNCK